MWACICFTSCRSSSPSSRACRVPSSRCDMVASILRAIRFDQPPPGPRQRGAYGPLRQSQRRSDLVIPEALGLEQQCFAVALVEPGQRGPDLGDLLVALEVRVRSCRGPILLVAQQLQPTTPG